MAIESSMYRFLSSDETISDLVGDQVYKYYVPQNGSYPAISFWRVSEDHPPDCDGVVQEATATIQIDVWSNDPKECEDITEAIRIYLQGQPKIGPVLNLDENLEATEITLDNIEALPEQPDNSSDDWVFHTASDYVVTYRQATA